MVSSLFIQIFHPEVMEWVGSRGNQNTALPGASTGNSGPWPGELRPISRSSAQCLPPSWQGQLAPGTAWNSPVQQDPCPASPGVSARAPQQWFYFKGEAVNSPMASYASLRGGGGGGSRGRSHLERCSYTHPEGFSSTCNPKASA